MPLDDTPMTDDRDGFLANARAVALLAMAFAVAPPPPVDLRAWAIEEMEFPKGDPQAGLYRADLFPMWDRVFEVLSLDHPATEVTLRGSGQIGKTTILNIFIGGTMSAQPVDVLKVDPTAGAVAEWKNTKFDRLRRTVPAVKKVFGAPRKNDSGDSTARVETLDGLANLRLVSAQSPSELSATTRRVVVMDDLSKFVNTDKGDPERLAITRARSFANPKIFRASVTNLTGDCRITKSFNRGTQEQYHVPCPHCGHEHPLLWENLEPNLRPGDPESAAFTCPDCGCLIQQHHRAAIVARGRWVAANPMARHPSFHIWSVYFNLGQGWGVLVDKWFDAKGDPAAEQTFFNDELGLPYAAATTAPEWESIRDRVENADETNGFDCGIIPARHPILVAGVDCQGDRIEYTVWAFGRDKRRAAIQKTVIPHHISTAEGKAALAAVMKAAWRNQHGKLIPLDRLAIDGGAFTDDVWDWAQRYPHTRVNVVKGASTDTGPIWRDMKFEQRKGGKLKRRQKQGKMLNVSVLKMSFYGAISKTDPAKPGFVSFARGLGDDFFRQITAEHRIARRSASGAEQWYWDKIDRSMPNEDLDCAVYADFAARMEGWRSLTSEQWDALEAERDVTPSDVQPGLFDGDTVAAQVATPHTAEKPAGKAIWEIA